VEGALSALDRLTPRRSRENVTIVRRPETVVAKSGREPERSRSLSAADPR